ncbi:hypothetical protein JAO71_11420 [Olleya sp. YSTF-M6]|uniref:Uncharacterized protein n=1 Tax=Olleya sediminilitoris TaxID=2795739 RepID=A0ABS1WMR7_9FLAO|nr:hypothetical protein [Olleya sediminilitoris]MBL7560412.1 hypothetical protein [Olleya sediminilitoris]
MRVVEVLKLHQICEILLDIKKDSNANMKKDKPSSSISKHSNWLKEHLNIIVLVPTLIGGIWQIWELLIISPSYIRFFSVTQVIADGLLSLFVLTMIYFAIRLGLMRFVSGKLEKPGNLNTKRIIGKIVYLFVISGVIWYIIYIILIPQQKSIVEENSLFILLLTIIIAIVVIGLLINLIFGIINILRFIPLINKLVNKLEQSLTNEKKSDSNSSKTTEFNESPKKIIIGTIVFILSFKFLLIPILGIIGQFRNEFILPKNFKNLEFIECRINSIYSKNTDFKIRYLNDTYIFVSVSQDENQEIVVLKFEDLLTNNCK